MRLNFHQIKVKVNSTVKPKFFVGSTLRGTFGHLLKAKVCMEPSYDCASCQYKDLCTYYEFYEQPSGFKRFRFDVRLDAKTYDFSIFLFTENIAYLRTLLTVLYRMLHSGRISSDKLSFPKSQIFLNESKIAFNELGIPVPFEALPQTLELTQYQRDVQVTLLTPCLIKDKHSGRPFKTNITLEDILLSVYKRKLYFENGTLPSVLTYTPSYTLITNKTHSVETTRRSNRQNKVVVLSGTVGKMVLMNLDPESYALLKWSEILAIGNKTAFGHGAIKIE